VLYAGPRIRKLEQLAAAFAVRFGEDVRSALSRVGPADAPGAHRMLLQTAATVPLRVGELEFLAALPLHPQQNGAAADGQLADASAPLAAFRLGELTDGVVVVARPAAATANSKQPGRTAGAPADGA
jgi:hypothetical protein